MRYGVWGDVCVCECAPRRATQKPPPFFVMWKKDAFDLAWRVSLIWLINAFLVVLCLPVN
jgi:hypothetical protein